MHKSERERSRRKLLLRIATVAVFLILITVVLVFISHWEKNQEYSDDPYESMQSGENPGSGPSQDDRQKVRYDKQWYALRENLETILFLGLDSTEENASGDGSYINDRRADFILLLVIDRDRESLKAIHINRDTMAEIPVLGVTGQQIGTTTAQLTTAHTYGSGGQDSCKNVAKAVSAYLYDTPVDHYLSITMDAVGILNDAVGGVTLTVMDDFSGYDDTLVQGEEVTLFGEHALRYVRARGGMEDSSNMRRMERQRQYMEALYKQLSKKIGEGDELSTDVLFEIAEYMVSDYTVQKLSDLMKTLSGYKFDGVDTIKGEAVLGEEYMEFYADEDALRKQIIELFYEPVQ